MKKSLFDPEVQNQNVTNKIIVALQRISEVFKTLLWDQAKQLGLSPIQIQLLIFVAYHKDSLCNVSHLAEEFNITKPTVSDAVRVLHKKGFIEKDFSSEDSRSYTIQLTVTGRDIVTQTEMFANPLQQSLQKVSIEDQTTLFSALSKTIFQLNQSGILTVQRTCYGCVYYRNSDSGHFCKLLNQALSPNDIRVDCPEYEIKKPA